MSFQNVAYDPKNRSEEQNRIKFEVTNRILTDELTRCGIDVVINPDILEKGEPYTNITGKFGRLIFERDWSYWRVYGLVPLETAKKIYAHPVGKTDVRVKGYGGGIEPSGNFIKWLDIESGKTVTSIKDKEEFESLITKYDEKKPNGGDWVRSAYKNYIFNDSPASIGAIPFIESYHIDSELGLYIFMQYIKEDPNIFNEIQYIK